MKIDKKEIKPITDVLGLAVLDSQRLEYSIAYLMLLANDEFDFTSKENDEMIDGFMLNLSKKTLGSLIIRLKKIVSINDEIAENLMEALDARNYLTHRFFNDQVENFLTIEGRKSALKLVNQKRRLLYECYFVLDPIIQALMKLRGFPPEFFSKEIGEKYESE